MKKIFAIAWKDTLIRFSGWSRWLFFLILPIVFTLVLAGGTGGSSDSRVRLVVVDQANSPLSADLVTALEQFPGCPSRFTDPCPGRNAVLPAQCIGSAHHPGRIRPGPSRTRPYPAGTAPAAQQHECHDRPAGGSCQSSAGSAVQSISPTTALPQPNRSNPSSPQRTGRHISTRLFKQAQSLLSAAPSRITESVGSTKDTIDYNPRTNSSAGQLITWVFIPLIGISSMFAYERQKGTLRRLLTTPTRKSTYLLGTIFGQVLTALVQMLLLIVFGIFVMKLNWGSQPLALAVMMVASTLAAAALGTTLGTFVKTESQASGLSIMTGMVMALLGGCWYPLEMFPQTVQNIVKILPTTWAMRGLLDIVLRGQGLTTILPVAGILLGFALLFFSIGIWRFKYE